MRKEIRISFDHIPQSVRLLMVFIPDEPDMDRRTVGQGDGNKRFNSSGQNKKITTKAKSKSFCFGNGYCWKTRAFIYPLLSSVGVNGRFSHTLDNKTPDR